MLIYNVNLSGPVLRYFRFLEEEEEQEGSLQDYVNKWRNYDRRRVTEGERDWSECLCWSVLYLVINLLNRFHDFPLGSAYGQQLHHRYCIINPMWTLGNCFPGRSQELFLFTLSSKWFSWVLPGVCWSNERILLLFYSLRAYIFPLP